jgi:hypothetical protein
MQHFTVATRGHPARHYSVRPEVSNGFLQYRPSIPQGERIIFDHPNRKSNRGADSRCKKIPNEIHRKFDAYQIADQRAG